MSIEKFVEEQIKKAMAEGHFDDLPGKGKPIDLTPYFDLPEDMRMSYSILKGANLLPEEAQLLKEVEELREKLDSCHDEEVRKAVKRKIGEKRLSLDLLLEKQKRRR